MADNKDDQKVIVVTSQSDLATNAILHNIPTFNGKPVAVENTTQTCATDDAEDEEDN